MVRIKWLYFETGSSSPKKVQSLDLFFSRSYHGLGKIFLQRTDSKYFTLRGLHAMCVLTTLLCHCSVEAAVDKCQKEWGWLCSNKTEFSKIVRGPDLDCRLQFSQSYFIATSTGCTEFQYLFLFYSPSYFSIKQIILCLTQNLITDLTNAYLRQCNILHSLTGIIRLKQHITLRLL